MILVYCDHITNRHRYIFGFIIEDILKMGLHLTDNKAEFLAYQGPKINYSKENIPGCIQVNPHPILSETGIRQQPDLVSFGIWNLEPGTLVPWNPGTGDPFALSFYLVTRYEEYLPFKPDAHGRYPAEESLAFRKNFLMVPLVDILAGALKSLLEKNFPALKIPRQTFTFLPSFDIDIAFAHYGKGWIRAGAAWVKLILKGDINSMKERAGALSGKIRDPYDNFDLHVELAKKYHLPLLYFVLIGDFSKYDRNTSFKSPKFRDLIKKLSLSASMGLHPSYRSHLRDEIYEKEKRRLENILHRPITLNRNHFLRLKFPESYRLLISQGITDDYSLGYSTTNGFRASTCTPFFFYDLDKEEITGLKIHPFIFMDSAMIDHLKMTPDEAIKEMEELTGQVQKYGGEAVGIWHNYALSEKDQYKGWRQVMVSTLERYQNQGL